MPSQEGGVNIHAMIWYIVLLSWLLLLTSYNSPNPITILAQAYTLDSLLCLLVLQKVRRCCLLLQCVCHGVDLVIFSPKLLVSL